MAAAYAQQVQNGEGYTFSYDPSKPVAAAPKKAPKAIPSAHAAYASAVMKKAAESETKAPIAQSVMVHITGITGQVGKKDLEAVFSKVGVIKIRKKTSEPNVWIGPDGTEASVTYEDPLAAQTAVELFNGKDVFGHGHPVRKIANFFFFFLFSKMKSFQIVVKPYSYDHDDMKRGGGRGRGGGGGGGGDRFGDRDGGGYGRGGCLVF